ncbi:MAG: site-specific DNA-methyltransferase, partial [Fusobacteriaceae bacterium]
MEKLKGASMDIVGDNIEKLKSIFPEIFSENKIDFNALKAVLGEHIDTENERYSFNWHGKSKARKIAQEPSTGTLLPSKDESKDWNNTDNLYIEGDNLGVLKLLQKSYHNKVKMIYIDPPYNTGKDFVYPDNFKDNLKNYLEITGQVGEEGQKLSTNSDTSGRYHSDWLNMMYPRLKLARNLLSDDGVILISIDDNEDGNLKKICDEIFGENNFIVKIIHKNNSMKNQSKFIGVTTEYIYIYTKNIDILSQSTDGWREKKKGVKELVNLYNRLKKEGKTLEQIKNEILDMYKRPKFSHLSRWNKVDEQGIFKDADLSREGGPKNYTIINPITGKECKIPPRGWAKSYEELLRLQEKNLIWYGSEHTSPAIKSYLTEDTLSVPDNFYYYDTSRDKKLIDILFGKRIFEFPKSLEMIKDFVEMISSKQDIILDFFSGSATTAHATMQLNAEDGGNRKYIMVQLPEPTPDNSEASKAGY